MDCQTYEKCSAPICPQNPDSMKHAIWYPGEPVCTTRPLPDWVLRQRKISRKCHVKTETHAWFQSMLAHPCRVTKRLAGIDMQAKGEESKKAEKWILGHPEIMPRIGKFGFAKAVS